MINYTLISKGLRRTYYVKSDDKNSGCHFRRINIILIMHKFILDIFYIEFIRKNLLKKHLSNND